MKISKDFINYPVSELSVSKEMYRGIIQVQKTRRLSRCYIADTVRMIMYCAFKYCFEGEQNNFRYISGSRKAEMLPYAVNRKEFQTNKIISVKLLPVLDELVKKFAYTYRLKPTDAKRMLISAGLAYLGKGNNSEAIDENIINELFTEAEIKHQSKERIFLDFI